MPTPDAYLNQLAMENDASSVALSPNKQWLAVNNNSANPTSLILKNLLDAKKWELTCEGHLSCDVVSFDAWSVDSRYLYYSPGTFGEGVGELDLIRFDLQTGNQDTLLEDMPSGYLIAFSNDMRYLAFRHLDEKSGLSIMDLSTLKEIPIDLNAASIQGFLWSPIDHRLAISVSDKGNSSIALYFPETQETKVISTSLSFSVHLKNWQETDRILIGNSEIVPKCGMMDTALYLLEISTGKLTLVTK